MGVASSEIIFTNGNSVLIRAFHIAASLLTNWLAPQIYGSSRFSQFLNLSQSMTPPPIGADAGFALRGAIRLAEVLHSSGSPSAAAQRWSKKLANPGGRSCPTGFPVRQLRTGSPSTLLATERMPGNSAGAAGQHHPGRQQAIVPRAFDLLHDHAKDFFDRVH